MEDYADFSKMMWECRDVFGQGRTLSYEFRLTQIQGLITLLDKHYEELYLALYKDLRKSRVEACMELDYVRGEAVWMRNKLRGLMKRSHLPFNLLVPLETAYIQNDPYGVVLILGAWNVPILTLLQPFLGAIAGGNSVVLKPSEHSSHVAGKMAELIPKYLNRECYRVVQGTARETRELLKHKFDYIFSTGSSSVGKAILTSAAPHLTPATLELGGKSPVYIENDFDIHLAVKRILFGKFLNLGQMCIAPDYILCSKDVQSQFVASARKTLKTWYGQCPQESGDLSRIINLHHFTRLCHLLDNTRGRVVCGGERDEVDSYISPTLVVDVSEEDVLMKEEIFGPILPFLIMETREEALAFITKRPKPLAIYIFSNDTSTLDYFINNTSSGGVCCNDVILQSAWVGLPFGGVGDSGMGCYHGQKSFETFTHQKAVVLRNTSATRDALTYLRYPPYSRAIMHKILSYAIPLGLNLFEMGNVSLSWKDCAILILSVVTLILTLPFGNRGGLLGN